MIIGGVSQTTGREGPVDVGADAGGLMPTVRGRGPEAVPAAAPAEELMAVLADRPAVPRALAGSVVAEVRRGEAWLTPLAGGDA